MMQTIRGFIALLALTAGACATNTSGHQFADPRPEATPEEEREAFAFPTAQPQEFDEKTWAAQRVSPSDCANGARDLRRETPDTAWRALRACAARAKFPRGDFTDLRVLLSDTWREDLSSRPDAPDLVARVVALRGGDVDGDLKRLQERRIPVFSLAAALKAESVYKGRHVLFRARIDEVRADKAGPSLRLAEIQLRTGRSEVEVAGTKTSYESSRTASYKARASTTRHGSGSASGSYSTASSSKSTKTRVSYENEASTTGRAALARLASADPFLEPGQEYVFLGRFEGARRSPDDEDAASPSIGALSIVAYYPPGAMLVD